MKDELGFADRPPQPVVAAPVHRHAHVSLLAFLSKGGVANIAKFAAIALGVYAIGVVAGAATFLTLTYCAEENSSYWEALAVGGEERKHFENADSWAAWSAGLILGAFGCFVVASFILAWAFYNYLA